MSNYKELKTICDFIRFASSRFYEAGLYFGHGTDNAWDEAAALVLHTLHLPYDVHPRALDANLLEEEKAAIIERINLRVEKRIPLAYITHEAWFASLPFYVDERVLIPRSPIAELIEAGFSPWINPDDVKNVLDLCTGSACIAIATAKYMPHVSVDAADISDDALQVAKTNVARHECQDQVKLIRSDLFANIPAKKYDIIVSNPPYVSEEEVAALPDEYRHEPVLGLEAGIKGLDIVKRILQHASDYLSEDGILIVEVGNTEYTLQEAYPEIPFTWLEFERGGGGVFILTASELAQLKTTFS